MGLPCNWAEGLPENTGEEYSRMVEDDYWQKMRAWGLA
jgi:hypothetical protein